MSTISNNSDRRFKPIIGMSTFIPAHSDIINLLSDKLFTTTIIKDLIPAEHIDCEVIGPNSLFLHMDLVISPHLYSREKKHVIIDTELIFEKLPPDNISPLIWDFYLSKCSLFYEFSGRIRVKYVNSGVKVGIFLEELLPKDESETGFPYNGKVLIGIVRTIFRQGLQRLEKCIKKKCSQSLPVEK